MQYIQDCSLLFIVIISFNRMMLKELALADQRCSQKYRFNCITNKCSCSTKSQCVPAVESAEHLIRAVMSL